MKLILTTIISLDFPQSSAVIVELSGSARTAEPGILSHAGLGAAMPKIISQNRFEYLPEQLPATGR